ncbi:unnamed protein product [Caenorhabditis bovis]|uniref:Uncharacterized protein n=1 Tax=Caenorhabditis bovis TaxID=2654633 RepID=A0A8S1EQI7_9PELO|nr:unnamed protein product [Caenorhabditis bovis]
MTNTYYQGAQQCQSQLQNPPAQFQQYPAGQYPGQPAASPAPVQGAAQPAYYSPAAPTYQQNASVNSTPSYQSTLPASVTPGWNDPPSVLPTGTPQNRLANMRRRPVDPSISGAGNSAPMATGYGNAYNQPQQSQQQQQQGYPGYYPQHQQQYTGQM